MEAGRFKAFFVQGMGIGLVIVLFVIVFMFFSSQKNDSGTEQGNFEGENREKSLSDTWKNPSEAVKKGRALSNGQCQGEEKPKITTLPMRFEDIGSIIPYGMTVGDHVTPIDHQYFSPAIFRSPRDAYEVRAMADAKLVNIEERATERGVEYRLVFSMSCTLFYYYDLVTSLSPELKKAYDDRRSGLWRGPIDFPVKAGQVIGRIGGQTLDFAVWDTDIQLSGFVRPEHYDSEPWKIHTADPLPYYTDELKAQALEKYLRTAEPVSGKIDYDIDGKLVGTWFLEGTGGYVPKGKQAEAYWKGHLSIAYDYLDPTSIVISLGNYEGREAQFGVKGNAPDPAKVAVSSGLVKYELVQQDWADPQTGERWDRDTLIKGLVAQNQERVQGTVLVQMLEPRKIKFETFPGQAAAHVSGFTPNARIFER